MTQHLYTGRARLCGPFDRRYLTACGRWVTSAQATGPAGVTCRACKATDAWAELSQPACTDCARW